MGTRQCARLLLRPELVLTAILVKFSIIVPVYNTADFLADCLRSLENLDYPRDQYEILMVDNGSTDGSSEMLAHANGITALQEQKRGAYAARNKALAHCRGEFLAFTDPDCMPHAGWLRAIEQSMETPDVQVVLGNLRPAYDRGLLRLISDHRSEKLRLICESDCPSLYFGGTNNLATRASTMAKHGPFAERMRGADSMFVHQVARTEGCDSVVYQPQMIVRHAEMDSLAFYLKKRFVYGRSWQRHRHLTAKRELRGPESLRIYQSVIRRNNYSITERAGLGVILAVAVVFWRLGAACGRLSPNEG